MHDQQITDIQTEHIQTHRYQIIAKTFQNFSFNTRKQKNIAMHI